MPLVWYPSGKQRGRLISQENKKLEEVGQNSKMGGDNRYKEGSL